jgi:isocitrate lyase
MMLRNISCALSRPTRHVTSMRPISPIGPISHNFTRMYSSALPPVNPPLSSCLPSDSYQLLSTVDKAGQAEDALFEQQVEDVKQWWSSPRYQGIKRPYSAEAVVSKRGALQQTYPSSLMARKLFNLLKERAAKGEPVHTSP